jgi:glycosyltransferase involved in cell wall biosynthesis
MMQINWFSPLPPEQTDIAHYTARIAPALMRRFDVVFWTDQAGDVSQLPRDAVVRRYDPAALHGRRALGELLSRINVYHFGNDARFHASIFRVARRFPGVAVLHDTRLHHFIFELYRSSRWSGYLELARRLYGPEGLARARSIVASDGRAIDGAVVEMPFLEAITDRSAAVICHSDEARQDVAARSGIPTAVLPLPFANLSGVEAGARSWSGPWRFVMFGYVNPNRRLESVLRALGELRGQIDFHFDIFGTLWDRTHIERLVGECQLADRVSIHGFVDERTLDAAIARAHLAFNLRHPTMGEASGGILRSWALATPALVTDAGWYATLPAEIAPRVRAENDVPAIRDAILGMVANPAAYRAIGEAARAHLLAHHAPEVYAQRLQTTLADAPRAMAHLAARQALERVAGQARSAAGRSVMLARAAAIVPQLLDT